MRKWVINCVPLVSLHKILCITHNWSRIRSFTPSIKMWLVPHITHCIVSCTMRSTPVSFISLPKSTAACCGTGLWHSQAQVHPSEVMFTQVNPSDTNWNRVMPSETIHKPWLQTCPFMMLCVVQSLKSLWNRLEPYDCSQWESCNTHKAFWHCVVTPEEQSPPPLQCPHPSVQLIISSQLVCNVKNVHNHSVGIN
jgi:hypothetical protein